MENLAQTLGLVPVQSTNIAAVGYQDGTLTIAFKSSGTYTYAAVPQEVYEGFLEAESKGKFFHQKVRGRFAYQRVEVQD